MEWNHELLASLIWIGEAFVMSLFGLAVTVAGLSRFTVWDRQFRRITSTYFNERRSKLPLGTLRSALHYPAAADRAADILRRCHSGISWRALMKRVIRQESCRWANSSVWRPAASCSMART